jgi:hypothetical protein
MQLDYVIAAAKQLGITLNASHADLAHMLANRLTKYKDIYLDDAVSGTRTKRPAFDAMIVELKVDPSISHLFVHKRDRLGRPRVPLSMMIVEEALKSAGVTIVTSEGVIAAGARGTEALGQSLVSFIGYHESGEFSRKLSERIITKHIELASQGYSTGGIPPYGFGRFLEKSDGTLSGTVTSAFCLTTSSESKPGSGYWNGWRPAGARSVLPNDSTNSASPRETPAASGTTTALSTRCPESGTRAPSTLSPRIRSLSE